MMNLRILVEKSAEPIFGVRLLIVANHPKKICLRRLGPLNGTTALRDRGKDIEISTGASPSYRRVVPKPSKPYPSRQPPDRLLV